MFSLQDVFFAFVIIALLILAGRYFKQKIHWLQRLHLPESIVAGFLALLLGPQVLGALATVVSGENSVLVNGLFSEPITAVWSQAPGVFINIVFAALFLGETIPSPAAIWNKAAPQVVFGQSLAWGQYVSGILVTLVLLVPVFGAHPISGALIEIGFEGGHGTAGGMAETFSELDFQAGSDLALGLATVGIVSGIIAGTALADWGRRRGHIPMVSQNTQEVDDIPSLTDDEELEPETERRRARLMRGLLIDPLSINFGIVGVAIVIGWLILNALILFESVTWGRTGFEIMSFVPLFPMALIGGILVQIAMNRLRLSPLIIEPMMKNIAGLALDVVIVTALASISLEVLSNNFAVFVILSVVGIAWNVLFFLYFAPKIFSDHWFERGLGDLGQSMGVTATGIVLLRMVDPDNSSGAFEGFAYKQLFFEPIVGGGLFTAASPALIARFGLVPVLILTAGLLLFWMAAGFFLIKQQKKASKRQVPASSRR